MSNPFPDTLALFSRVLRVLIKLNLLMGALIMALGGLVSLSDRRFRVGVPVRRLRCFGWGASSPT